MTIIGNVKSLHNEFLMTSIGIRLQKVFVCYSNNNTLLLWFYDVYTKIYTCVVVCVFVLLTLIRRNSIQFNSNAIPIPNPNISKILHSHIITFAHSHIFTFSHSCIFAFSQQHKFTFSYYQIHIVTFSHSHILMFSQSRILTYHIRTYSVTTAQYMLIANL